MLKNYDKGNQINNNVKEFGKFKHMLKDFQKFKHVLKDFKSLNICIIRVHFELDQMAILSK